MPYWMPHARERERERERDVMEWLTTTTTATSNCQVMKRVSTLHRPRGDGSIRTFAVIANTVQTGCNATIYSKGDVLT